MEKTRFGRAAFKPPKIEMAQWPLSTWSLLRVMVRNPVATVPPAAYQEPHASLLVGRQAMFYPSDPALVEAILVRKHEDFAKSTHRQPPAQPNPGQRHPHGRGRRLAMATSAGGARFSCCNSVEPSAGHAQPVRGAGWALDAEPGPHRIDDAMTAATIAVICRAFFSNFDQGDADRVSGAIARYLRPASWPITYEALGLPKWTPHPGKLTMERAAADARQLVRSFVAQRRQGRKDPPDLAQILMDARDPETGRALSDEDLVNMFLTLIAAGHETSANALTWALYCLAAQPELQDALADHVRNVIGDGPVEAPHLEALPDVTQFIEETMRLLPPVPMLSRRPLRLCQIGGHSIEPTMLVLIPIYAIHRHRTLWSSPRRLRSRALRRRLSDPAAALRLHAIRCRAPDLPRRQLRDDGDGCWARDDACGPPLSPTRQDAT